MVYCGVNDFTRRPMRRAAIRRLLLFGLLTMPALVATVSWFRSIYSDQEFHFQVFNHGYSFSAFVGSIRFHWFQVPQPGAKTMWVPVRAKRGPLGFGIAHHPQEVGWTGPPGGPMKPTSSVPAEGELLFPYRF